MLRCLALPLLCCCIVHVIVTVYLTNPKLFKYNMNRNETWADCDRGDESDERWTMYASYFDDHVFWRPDSTTNEQVPVHLVLLLTEVVDGMWLYLHIITVEFCRRSIACFRIIMLQAGRADVQDTAYVSTGVSQSAHPGTQRHSVTAIIGCSVSRCAVQTQWQTDIGKVLRLQLGTLCLLLSSTVTLSL